MLSAVQRKNIVFALILFFCLAQFVIFVVDREHWFDVSFSLETVNKMRTEGMNSIDFRQYDVHPPMYYHSLYFWSYLNPGMSEYHWAQQLSVLYMLGFLAVAGIALSKLFGDKGSIAIILLAMGTTYVHYGTEARTYALILLLSAVVFYAVVVERLLGKWLWIGAMALMLLPLTHYFAAMAIPFFVLVHVAWQKKWMKSWSFWNKEDRLPVTTMLIAGGIGLAWALTYALPQRARVAGTWFQNPTMASWPSSAMFSIIFPGESGELPFIFTMSMYVLFLILLAVCAFVAYKWMSKKNVSDERFILILMGITVLAPLAGIVGAPVLGGDGFAHLYHHRFFLVLTWMFAAALMVGIVNLSLKDNRYSALIVVGVVGVLGIMQVAYALNAHHELSDLMENTPCYPTEDLDGSGILYATKINIVHESPFSSLPFEVYKREHGCAWRNVVSTNISVRASNGAGFDVISDDDKYWNLTLPGGNYYYVRSLEATVPMQGDVRVVAESGGVDLVYVKRPVVNIGFG